MKWSLPLALWIVSICAPFVVAQEDDKEIGVVKENIEEFFDDLAKDSEKAFETLLKDGPFEEPSRFSPLIKKYNGLMGGDDREYLGVEDIDAKRVGEDLILVKYLYKMDKFPVVWYFTYYRARRSGTAEGKWFVVALRFDTRLELLGLGELNPDGRP